MIVAGNGTIFAGKPPRKPRWPCRTGDVESKSALSFGAQSETVFLSAQRMKIYA